MERRDQVETKLKPFTCPMDVRFRDLDGLGHINNAVFVTYLEQARTHFIEAAGMSSVLSSSERLPIILARTEIDYLKPGYLHHKIAVNTWISHVGAKSFHMGYEVIANDKDTLARAKAVLVWYDYDEHSSTRIPDTAREILSRLVMT